MAASELDNVGNSAAEYWCLGCRSIGERPLDEAERAWITVLRSGHQRRMLLGLALVPAALLVLALVVTFKPAGAADTWLLGIAAFATIGIALPVAIALVRAHGAARGRLAEDLVHDMAWVFEAPPEARDAVGAGLHMVASDGAGEHRQAEEDGESADRESAAAALLPTDFALLKSSRRVVNPADPSLSVVRADVIAVAPYTGSQLYAPLSLQVIHRTPDTSFGQRALSAAERAELVRIARRLAVPAFGTLAAIGMLVLIVALLKSFRPELKHAPLGDFLSTGVAIVLCIRVLIRYLRGMKLAVRIQEDLRLGLVVRVARLSSPAQEFLPASRLLWRSAGAPAAWRDHRKAVARLRAGL